MTQQMKEALEKRNIIWGERNESVLAKIRRELKNPKISITLWAALRGLKFIGTGYSVKIAAHE
jgi:hypothetical protein